MSPRTGRPKIDNPKNHDIKIRIDEKMDTALRIYAEKNNITRTEAIRQAINQFLRQ